jgi:glycosyltransferase involved in cell wall biosynthesis
LYFLDEAGRIGRALHRAGVEGAERLQRRRYDPSAALRLRRYFLKDKPDILFILDHHNAMLWGRAAGIMARVPAMVVASHATGLFGRGRNFRLPDRWLMEFTDRVVALSRSHAEYLVENEGVAPGQVAVIENGIPVDEFRREGVQSADEAHSLRSLRSLRKELGLREDDRVVIMVAALRPEKAHEVFLESARLLVATRRDLKFLVVGDGSRRAELESLCKRLGLDDCVRFLGVRRDVARLLHLADVLTLPSHPVVETLPLTVLEAMAAGVPVVATRVGSLPEIIDHGRNGLLIDSGDAAALAGAIESVVDDDVRAREMAEAAGKTVEERYSVETMVENYAALFESLANR